MTATIASLVLREQLLEAMDCFLVAPRKIYSNKEANNDKSPNPSKSSFGAFLRTRSIKIEQEYILFNYNLGETSIRKFLILGFEIPDGGT